MGIAIAEARAAETRETSGFEDPTAADVQLRRLLLICGAPPAQEIAAQFESQGVEIDVVPDGIGAVKRLWEQRYDAILAEAECARVGGHRLGDVVADLSPGTAVVVLKPGQRIFPPPPGADTPALGSQANARQAAAVVGELIVAMTLAVKRRAARRK